MFLTCIVSYHVGYLQVRVRLCLGLQPHHFSFETSYASFHHRIKVISFEKSSLTPPRVEPDAPCMCSQGLSFCPLQRSSQMLTAGFQSLLPDSKDRIYMSVLFSTRSSASGSSTSTQQVPQIISAYDPRRLRERLRPISPSD